jgi:ribonucleotide reductase alpha subunit
MEQIEDMRVTKRNGVLEYISFDKILQRIKVLCYELNLQLNFSALAMKVIDQLYDKIPTTKIDELTSQQCASLITQHPDYGILAAKVIISNYQKNTDSCFYNVMKQLYEFKDTNKNHSPLIDENMWNIIQENQSYLESLLVHDRDYLIDYFGFKTLERAYLMKINEKNVERPQHLWLRVSLGIHGTDMDKVKETYHLMSKKYFTHATPTLFNAGTPYPQLSSCFLVAMEDDSLEGIFNTLHECAKISKWSGGIGLHVHNIRGSNSLIRGTNGKSSGLVPMLKVFNDTARFINQGGKRNGSFAVYLEPWHCDIEDFLNLRKNHGDEEMRARDLFYALWVPDLFMMRVKENGSWSLFSENECPLLSETFGNEFKILYEQYEKENKQRKTINARDLWFKILDSQMETGTPYLCYKDAVNQKNNQKNLGIIKSSNLCAEIMEYSNEKETAVCNLASIALPTFVNNKTREFNYEKLHEVVKVITNNLNKVIDINFYPTEKTKRSNKFHRPIGIGVQGLADVFILMDIPFYSDEARKVNLHIFETMYHAGLEKSYEMSLERYNTLNEPLCKLFKFYEQKQQLNYLTDYIKKNKNDVLYKNIEPIFENDDKNIFSELKILNYAELLQFIEIKKENNNACFYGAYSSFNGSPAHQGQLQYDLWNVKPTEGRYDWETLKKNIQTYGLRNSLLISTMPTASTSQILGFNECFEPLTSNIYTRRTLAGEFIILNNYLIRELIDMGIYNEKLKNNIIANNGSIQHLTMLPEHIRNKYKIVWEIPMKHLIDMSADRGAFICQSQSLNLWQEDPNYNSLTSMHFYGWKMGLKTGIYYLRRKAKHQAQQFTLEPDKAEQDKNMDNIIDNEEKKYEICDICSA